MTGPPAGVDPLTGETGADYQLTDKLVASAALAIVFALAKLDPTWRRPMEGRQGCWLCGRTRPHRLKLDHAPGCVWTLARDLTAKLETG